jgi:hypothetical protein
LKYPRNTVASFTRGTLKTQAKEKTQEGNAVLIRTKQDFGLFDCITGKTKDSC